MISWHDELGLGLLESMYRRPGVRLITSDDFAALKLHHFIVTVQELE